MTDLSTIQQKVVETFDAYDQQGTARWTAETASHDLQYQIGSLAKAILQLNGKRYPEGLSEAELREAIADELADTIANVLYIAAELDIDIEAALNGMFASDQKKIEERS